MLPTLGPQSSAHRKLLQVVSRLKAADQAAVLAFAEFLLHRHLEGKPMEEPKVLTPHPIPRPMEESVVGAIKRLAKTYHMLDREEMLHETSSLMGEHVMQGRSAKEVIDDLEVLFVRHYERFQKGYEGNE